MIGGDLFVAWSEFDAGGREVRVSRLNAAGNDWEEVVGGASPINFEPTGNGNYVSFTSVGGVPYVAWVEQGTPSGEQLRVSRLEPEFLSHSAIATANSALVVAEVQTYGVRYPIATQYGPGVSLNQQSPLRTSAGQQINTVTLQIDGLTPSTLHSYRPIGFDGTYATGPGTTGTFTTGAPGTSGAPARRVPTARRAPTAIRTRRPRWAGGPAPAATPS